MKSNRIKWRVVDREIFTISEHDAQLYAEVSRKITMIATRNTGQQEIQIAVECFYKEYNKSTRNSARQL